MPEIVRAAIHPGIGIARIGNSDAYFLAPQVTTPAPRPPGFHHDAQGALRREAVEFRIYGYDAQGRVVAELTAANAVVEWDVHIAATKPAWYKFSAAMDLGAASGFRLERRNPDYPADRRDDLRIDPGPRRIGGAGAAHAPLSGRFRWFDHVEDVLIGEIATDAAGRLVLMSGKGRSASPAGLPVFVGSEQDAFGNATGWYDGVADGPVSATVRLDGREIPCAGAWAVVAPPSYAPEILGWRTLLDLVEELYRDAGWIAAPARVSFTADIYPLLARLTNLQWVNQGFAAMFGAGGPLDFADPGLIDRIARVHGSSDAYGQLRQSIFNAFRPADGSDATPRSWPWIYGDAFGTLPASDPATHLPLSPGSAARLRDWAQGDFVADWGAAPPPSDLERVDLADQPAMLDRAPLHFCLADAFHPGCELTWPMRRLSIYEAPFRIRRRPADAPAPDYGTHLTTRQALASDGPLQAQGPGDLTRWMALPWQADTAGCRSGYDLGYDPYLPTFWPARVPNQVLTEAAYRKVMDTTLPREDRLDAFHARRSWYHPLEGRGGDQMTLMVKMFAAMGVVERRDGPIGDPDFPSTLFVERLPPDLDGLAAAAGAPLAGPAPAPPDTPAQRAARAAGWESEAQRLQFQRARFPSI
jgi:hypothetical protein